MTLDFRKIILTVRNKPKNCRDQMYHQEDGSPEHPVDSGRWTTNIRKINKINLRFSDPYKIEKQFRIPYLADNSIVFRIKILILVTILTPRAIIAEYCVDEANFGRKNSHCWQTIEWKGWVSLYTLGGVWIETTKWNFRENTEVIPVNRQYSTR